MRLTIKYLLIFLLLASSAYSQTINMRFGQGSGDTKGKIISGSYHGFIWKDFVIGQFTAGTLNGDNIQGTDYTFFYELSIGAEIKLPIGLYAKFNQGVALLNETTNRLDSKLQWPTTLSAGFHHKNKHLGIFWKHFSSGTTSSRNRGQEYIGLELGFTL